MEENKPQLSRRDALKALAAAGGALTAAAFLPGKWAKPLVETGVLPAHAQSSCPTITDWNYGFCESETICPNGGRYYITVNWAPPGPISGYTLTFGGVPVQVFNDPFGDSSGQIDFTPSQNSQGWIVVLTLEWGNCPPGVIQFEWPN